MKIAVSYRLSSKAVELLKAMALSRAISDTSMLEITIREKARKEPKS